MMVETAKADGTVIISNEIGTVNLHGQAVPTGDESARGSLAVGSGFVGGTAALAAIRCQEFIIRQYTGTELPEESLVYEARVNGWYHDDRGTTPGDIGKLLELHGIPVRRYADANPWQLATELGNGHQVIIGIENHGGWHQNSILADLHCRLSLDTAAPIVATRADPSDAGPERVVVITPGMSRTAARYSMGQFLSAWKDSDFFMVATQEPPPVEIALSEMRYSDLDASEIDGLDAADWEDFQTETSVAFDNVLSRLDPRRHEHHERSDGQPQDNDEMQSLIDPSHHEQHEPLATPFDGGLQESYSPLAYDLDDPFGENHEDDLFGTDGDDLGDDGEFDFG